MHGRRMLLHRVVRSVVVAGGRNEKFHLAVRSSALDSLVGMLVDVGKVLDQFAVFCRLDFLGAHHGNLLGQSRKLRLVVPVLVRLRKLESVRRARGSCMLAWKKPTFRLPR
jgi:hypothetical protein